MKTRILFLCLICIFTTSCAFVFGRTTQKINITTSDIAGARCTLDIGDGLRYQVITPTVLFVERSPKDMIIKCSKTGYKNGYKTVSSTATFKKVWRDINYYTPGISTDVVTQTIYSYPNSIDIKISAE